MTASTVWWNAGFGPAYMQLGHSIFMKSVGRYYIMQTNNWKLLCWDFATKEACDETPLVGSSPHTVNTYQDPAYRGHMIQIDSTRLFVKTDLTLYCFNVPSMEPCSAGWPISIGEGVVANISVADFKSTWAPSMHQSVRGVNDGICLYMGCLTLDGQLANWTAIYKLFSPNSKDFHYGYLATFITTMGRFYPYNPYNPAMATTTIPCYDYVEDKFCGAPWNAVVIPNGKLYTTRLDPGNPYCI